MHTEPNYQEQSVLLRLARESISHGLRYGKPLRVNAEGATGILAAPHGNFVTLSINEALRGCIGSLQSSEALVTGVAGNAFKSAFQDPRFGPLSEEEFEQVDIDIAILSVPEAMQADSREALLNTLVPGRDGLIISDGPARATFLPKVWEQLPAPELFLARLMEKAGLPAEHWSDTMHCQRYAAISVNAHTLAAARH